LLCSSVQRARSASSASAAVRSAAANSAWCCAEDSSQTYSAQTHNVGVRALCVCCSALLAVTFTSLPYSSVQRARSVSRVSAAVRSAAANRAYCCA
jgi:hypothetical protein